MDDKERPQPAPQTESLGESVASVAVDAVDLATTPDLGDAASSIADAAGGIAEAADGIADAAGSIADAAGDLLSSLLD